MIVIQFKFKNNFWDFKANTCLKCISNEFSKINKLTYGMKGKLK